MEAASICFTNLDQDSKLIIFDSFLTTFIASVSFRGRWGNSKNWLDSKIE
jgi:hypothetical protein